MTNAAMDVLHANLKNLSSSIFWLRRSYEVCQVIGTKKEYTDDEFDDFENLTSRYARTTDLIINKILRSIDIVEFIETGSVIDAANHAEKRGIINSVSDLRNLKDLRNEIAHEYETDDLASLFSDVLNSVPSLFTISERISNYCAGKYTS